MNALDQISLMFYAQLQGWQLQLTVSFPWEESHA